MWPWRPGVQVPSLTPKQAVPGPWPAPATGTYGGGSVMTAGDPTTEAAPRVVVVTGASSGIGAATARLLARRGDTVALVARRADRLDQVLADCTPHAPASRRWAADLADPDRAARLVLQIWDTYDGVDAVVNNAGIPMRRPVTRLTMAEV